MRKLGWYHWTSIGLHFLMILAMVEIQLTPRDSTALDVYEVDIVADVPSMGQSSPNAAASAVKVPLTKKKETPQALDAIQKEKALPETRPELMPSKIEPPERKEEEPEPAARSDLPARGPSRPVTGPGRLGRSTDEYAAAIAMWKSQVRYLVDRVWKTPPEIASVDMSLKTTYLLRISRSGELLDKRLLVSSGNNPFDRSIQIALNGVKRLPQPPSVLLGIQDSVEVTMSFTPPKGAQ